MKFINNPKQHLLILLLVIICSTLVLIFSRKTTSKKTEIKNSSRFLLSQNENSQIENKQIKLLKKRNT